MLAENTMGVVPKWVGRILAVLTGMVLPLAVLYYVPVFLITAAQLWFSGRSVRVRRSGSDSALGLELRATLLLFPMVSIWTSISTTLGAQAISRDQTGFASTGGVWIFGGALISISAVLITVHVLHQHRIGIAVAPFERDVDPAAGLAKIAEWQESRHYRLLPQRDHQAQLWASSVADPEAVKHPSFIRALRLLLDPRATGFGHFPLMLIGWLLTSAALDVTASLTVDSEWEFNAFDAGSTLFSVFALLLCATTQLMMQGQYQLRLRARQDVLSARLAAAQNDPTPPPSDNDEIKALLTEVLAELRLTRSGAVKSSPSAGTAHTAPLPPPG